MVAILHNIRSAHNVGSMFRTADAAGVEKLYLCGITASPADMLGSARKSLEKTALGAEKSVPWEKRARAADCIRRLKAEGFAVYAVELTKASVPYHTADFLKRNAERTAFVVGNEVDGLPASVIGRCDGAVYIPMHGKKESLNVAVAFGIIAFEIARHRLR